MTPTESARAKLVVALDTHQRLVDAAESFRAIILEPQIMEEADRIERTGTFDSIQFTGEQHYYTIDRRGRVMTKKKG